MLKNFSIRLCLPIIGWALCASGVARAGFIFNTNLISNPGAEAGTGAVTNNIVVPVPGWINSGGFTVTDYRPACTVDCWPGLPYTTDPGPTDRGAHLFSGGSTDFSVSYAHQVVDVSNAAAILDTGTVPFILSGYLGGYYDQRDNATFSPLLQNASGATLATATIGPVTLADRTNAQGPYTGLLFMSTSGLIPTGTRQIDFTLTMKGIDGAQNDGYADNLSFIATNGVTQQGVPEPASIGLIGLGLVALGAFARRAKKA